MSRHRRDVSWGVCISDRLVWVSQPPPVTKATQEMSPAPTALVSLHRVRGCQQGDSISSASESLLGSSLRLQVSAGAITPLCSLRMAEWYPAYLGVVSPPLAIFMLCIAQGRDLVRGGNRPLSKSHKEISFAVGETLLSIHPSPYRVLPDFSSLCTV